MITTFALICGIALSCELIPTGASGMFVTSKIGNIPGLPPALAKERNRDRGFEYILKRAISSEVNDDSEIPDDPESKERRSSSMGSSFIRFGRRVGFGGNPLFLNAVDNPDSQSSDTVQQPHTRSDTIIRYGRSGKPDNFPLFLQQQQHLQIALYCASYIALLENAKESRNIPEFCLEIFNKDFSKHPQN